MSIIVKAWKDKGFLNGDFTILRTFAIEMPGFKKFVNDSLMFEFSGKNLEYLAKQKDLQWQPEAKVHLDEHLKCVDLEKKLIESKQKIDAGEIVDDYCFKTDPFDHQRKAFLLGRDQEYYGYFMEMGTGKTKVMIDTAAYMYQRGRIDCVIILAPNGVHAQWIDEQLPLHLPEAIPYRKAIYRASVPKAMKEVQAILNIPEDAAKCLNIVSFNIDCLSGKKGVDIIHKFLEKYDCLMIMDESTRIKTPGAARTKNALGLAPLAKFRRILSGAPITNGYEGLYAQFKFLSPAILGFNSYYTFRNYFCIMGGFEGHEVVGYKPNARIELEQKVNAYTFRVTKAECLTLPEKIYVKRIVELTKEQAEIYDALEEDLLTELNGKIINTPITLTRLLRMQQVVCGHIVDEDKEIHDIPSNRIEALIEAIDEALLQPDTKIIIWSRFVHDIYKISSKLREKQYGHVLYYGEVKQRDREKAIQKFKTDPSCRIFLAQPASGGTGLNLAEASVVIYFSNDFNADTRWQSEDRAHRIGQKKSVTYIDLVAKGTTDVEVLGALRGKKNLADALLDDPRGLIPVRRKDVA